MRINKKLQIRNSTNGTLTRDREWCMGQDSQHMVYSRRKNNDINNKQEKLFLYSTFFICCFKIIDNHITLSIYNKTTKWGKQYQALNPNTMGNHLTNPIIIFGQTIEPNRYSKMYHAKTYNLLNLSSTGIIWTFWWEIEPP